MTVHTVQVCCMMIATLAIGAASLVAIETRFRNTTRRLAQIGERLAENRWELWLCNWELLGVEWEVWKMELDETRW